MRDGPWLRSPFLFRRTVGLGGAVERVVLAITESLGFSSHSLLAYAAGPFDEAGSPMLGQRWTGERNITYLGFSSLKERWDSVGVDRTAAYDGALWLTEFANPAVGWPAADSERGIETLQHLYWYALTAQAKGCKALFIYPPWSPESLDVDASTMSHAQFWLDWLAARSDITIPAFMMPVPVIVRHFREYYGATSIFRDDLHLRGREDSAPNLNMDALAVGLEMMMTGARPADDPAWSAELVDLIDIVWADLQAHACTGLGGSTTIAPSFSGDPLPDPLQL